MSKWEFWSGFCLGGGLAAIGWWATTGSLADFALGVLLFTAAISMLLVGRKTA